MLIEENLEYFDVPLKEKDFSINNFLFILIVIHFYYRFNLQTTKLGLKFNTLLKEKNVKILGKKSK